MGGVGQGSYPVGSVVDGWRRPESAVHPLLRPDRDAEVRIEDGRVVILLFDDAPDAYRVGQVADGASREIVRLMDTGCGVALYVRIGGGRAFTPVYAPHLAVFGSRFPAAAEVPVTIVLADINTATVVAVRDTVWPKELSQAVRAATERLLADPPDAITEGQSLQLLEAQISGGGFQRHLVTAEHYRPGTVG